MNNWPISTCPSFLYIFISKTSLSHLGFSLISREGPYDLDLQPTQDLSHRHSPQKQSGNWEKQNKNKTTTNAMIDSFNRLMNGIGLEQ